MIEITGLSKSYGRKQVLQDIHLHLEPGKVYGIAGKNGSGKTTLFRCIAGLEQFEGEITSPYDPLKNHIGLLTTTPIFLSRITGWEYLKLLCTARGINEDQFEEQNLFDLPLNQYAETYSTGMKKKLALMGVLLQQNDIFILDEPFNGVDIQSNILIEGIIAKLKQANKTVLISSHIFSTLSTSCDEIHLLDEGRFVKRVTQEHYADLEAEMKQLIQDETLHKLRIE